MNVQIKIFHEILLSVSFFLIGFSSKLLELPVPLKLGFSGVVGGGDGERREQYTLTVLCKLTNFLVLCGYHREQYAGIAGLMFLNQRFTMLMEVATKQRL